MFSHHQLYQEDLVHTSALNIDWQLLEEKKILITGASGLVGTFLIDVLMYRIKHHLSNYTIYAAGRNKLKLSERFSEYESFSKNFKIIELDVNKAINSNVNYDYIVHAASNTHPLEYAQDPVGSITTNLWGAYHLLQYGISHNLKRFIYLSSVEIYGEALSSDDIFDESYCGYIDCNTVRAGYPESKRVGESLCQSFAEKYGIEVVIARLSRLFGPTICPDDSKALSQFLHRAINGEDITLKSTGTQRYSYTYIADAVAALLYIWLHGKNREAYNIANANESIMLKDIAENIAKNVGTKVIYDIPSKQEQTGFSKVSTAIMDVSKLQQLGWKNRFSLLEGIQRNIKILLKK